MGAVLWEPGDVVVWRETWHGVLWGIFPVRVVEDAEEATAAYLAEGTEFALPVEPDGSWRWKDEENMGDWVRRRRFTPEQVAAIRREGERVLAEWPFPTGWEEWAPDPSWQTPRLPEWAA
jgi:hypothetical protein